MPPAFPKANWPRLEETGQSAKKINFPALAQTARPESGKTRSHRQRLAARRQKICPSGAKSACSPPRATDLTVNCFLVWDEVTRDAALFDTGLDAQAGARLHRRRTASAPAHFHHALALGPRRGAAENPRGVAESAAAFQLQKRARGPAQQAGGNRPSRRPARDAPRDARPCGGRRDLHRRQLAGGRAASSPSSATRFLPARWATATARGIWRSKKCANKFCRCRRKPCFAPATAR